MKKKIFFIILIFLPFFSNTIVSNAELNDDTDINVTIKKNISSYNPNSNSKKEPIYTPDSPKIVQILPQTGEILTSFMYSVIGLSLLIFFSGLFFNKYIIKNMNWRY